MVGGLLLQAIGMGWIALIAEPGLPTASWCAADRRRRRRLDGLPAAQNSVVGAVPGEAVGKASGANSMMRELGGVFGIAISVAVFAGAGSYASAAAFSDGFAPAIAVAAALSLRCRRRARPAGPPRCSRNRVARLRPSKPNETAPT